MTQMHTCAAFFAVEWHTFVFHLQRCARPRNAVQLVEVKIDFQTANCSRCRLGGFTFTVRTECTGTQRKCQIVQHWCFETPNPHLKTRFCSEIVPRTGLTLLWSKFYRCGAFTELAPTQEEWKCFRSSQCHVVLITVSTKWIEMM